MSGLRIAAAQSSSLPGDIDNNILRHLAFIGAARDAAVNVLVFPELSLCGYELALLPDCVLAPDDVRLAPIRELAVKAQMHIVVGAPLAGDADGLPYIGAIIFAPDGTHDTYRKQYLHGGEEVYAAAGPVGAHCLRLGAELAALAICADTGQAAHASAAADAGATLYLAGVLVSGAGYAADAAKLQGYAASLGMAVLMANHGAPSGGYVSAGRSAFWDRDGRLVAATDGPGDYLLILDHAADGWRGDVIEVGSGDQ